MSKFNFTAIILCLLMQLICISSLLAQNELDTILLEFEIQFENELLQLDSIYVYKGETLVFTNLKFYISKLSLKEQNEVVWEELDSYHLMDFTEETEMKSYLRIPSSLQFDEMALQLGTDSVTNVSGVMGGDLDPMKGMYWAWNTGYINFKLEGNSPFCPTRKNEFQFHLGGYRAPYQTVQSIQLKIDQEKVKSDSHILVKIDLFQFFEQIDLSQQHSFMSPGSEVQVLSELISTLFFCDEKK